MFIGFISRRQLGKGAVLILCLLIASIGLYGFYQQKEMPVSIETLHKPIYQGDTSKKAIALTINIDWGEEYIEPMLDIFEKENIKVTFFPTGNWASRFPEMIKLIHEKGHEIGNHGYSHPHVDQLSKEENKQEIIKTQKIIRDLTGIETVLFASPYGEKKQHVIDAAGELGHKTIFWTIDTIDWQKHRTAEAIANRVIENAQNGAIVLMHPTENTTKALPIMIKALKEKGYELTTVSNIL
ncbi:polysaccharide deacetylase family protein [Desulfitibacter alkalitolerans]|uniref:polysaccharide deacetylase family protein n=1 Tax=Desulfitibacter alkalitolerans TaxID=264641 RepID=UPI0004863E76|nr:polysaccharide deacetylase family protein [Desulfitibacter alkalitolerans]